MRFKETKSGLVVPETKPPKPKRQYEPLEIQDEEKREQVAKAMGELWRAMELSTGNRGIVVSSYHKYEAHYKAWRYLGDMLLGKDCPEFEIKT